MKTNKEQDAQPVKLAVEDVIDLHTFRPGEIPNLLTDYFSECRAAGIFSVRVIHGKGTGMLRKRVHARLAKMPEVAEYKDASPEAGGWGATLVVLKR